MRAAAAAILMACLTGCWTTFVQLHLPQPSVTHGIRGKVGEFDFAVINGPELVTVSRVHDLDPGHFSEKRTAKLLKSNGPDSLMLLYGEGMGWFFRDNAVITRESGRDWVANAVAEGLRNAGYTPKRLTSLGTGAARAVEVTLQNASADFAFVGASTQIMGRVVLEVRLFRGGKEVKKAVLEGKGQKGVHAGTTRVWEPEMSNALGDALMQTFQLIREADL